MCVTQVFLRRNVVQSNLLILLGPRNMIVPDHVSHDHHNHYVYYIITICSF